MYLLAIANVQFFDLTVVTLRLMGNRLNYLPAKTANQSIVRAHGENGRMYDRERAQSKPFVVVEDL